MIRVLFVCLGNICRSPSAEGVLRALVAQAGLEHRISIDSAGTGAWHIGEPPDSRAQQAAAARRIDLSGQRARQVSQTDFDAFDYILGMDRQNLTHLKKLHPPSQQSTTKLGLFLDYSDTSTRDVPDPYYGGREGFDAMLDLIEEAAEKFLRHLQKELALALKP